jgi:Stealth protein CR2, conserved region 2/Stealth protein CR3, conserved region 3/Stealth protein CR4, conserved region 4/Stealth protein CR1, conserved region 1
MSLVPFVHPDTMADLQTMHDLLAAAGLPFWLVRHRWGVAVAVGESGPGIAAADTAMRGLAALRGDGLNGMEATPGIVRVGRSADTGRWVEVERWNIGARNVTCPRANALTREQFDTADLEPTVVEIFGRQWPTLAGMFGAHPGDVGFDIDMVFSWVDGTDPVLSSSRARWLPQVVLGDGDDSDARTRQVDELRYALRSVRQNAPWVRRIFIVSDSRLPNWLIADHPEVTVVRAAEHFSDLSALPTFNSHAVETQLHRIEGLAEHFLYCNDDMFVGRRLAPSMFFTAGGISRFIESAVRIGGGAVDLRRSGHENAARNNRRLLADRLGYVITRHLAHSPAPLRRSVLAELEAEFPREFAATQASRFRSATDVSVTNSLYHYYALLTGRAVPHESASARYIETTSYEGLGSLGELLAQRDADFFCLNDGGTPEVDEDYRAATVSDFLACYFPCPAPWERDWAGQRHQSRDMSRRAANRLVPAVSTGSPAV